MLNDNISAKMRRKMIAQSKRARFMNIVRNPFIVISFLFLLIEAASIIYALVWSTFSSLKSITDFTENMFGAPKVLHVVNYVKIYKHLSYDVWVSGGGIKTYEFMQLLGNSVLYAVFPPAVTVFSMMAVAYATSKYNFKASKVLDTIVLIVVIFPGVNSLGQNIQFLRRIGFYDHYWALLLGNIAFADYNYLIWKGIFKGISNDFIDAAKVDGAGHYHIFFSIVIPLIRAPLMIFYVLGFIGMWNNYNIPLYTIPSMPNLALVLHQLRDNTINEIAWPMYQLAGAMIVALPCIVVYVFIEPLMGGDLLAGGIKG